MKKLRLLMILGSSFLPESDVPRLDYFSKDLQVLQWNKFSYNKYDLLKWNRFLCAKPWSSDQDRRPSKFHFFDARFKLWSRRIKEVTSSLSSSSSSSSFLFFLSCCCCCCQYMLKGEKNQFPNWWSLFILFTPHGGFAKKIN